MSTKHNGPIRTKMVLILIGFRSFLRYYRCDKCTRLQGEGERGGGREGEGKRKREDEQERVVKGQRRRREGAGEEKGEKEEV